jgi:hypothetical protein
LAEQKEKAKSQSVMALDLGTVSRKLRKSLERALGRLTSNKVVTLDISQTGARIMETRGGVVRNWADVSFTPEETEQIAGGGENILGTKVRQLLDSSGIKAKNVTVSISGMYTVSRLIPVANLPPEQTLDESVNEIAQDIMPVPTESLYLFWQAMGSTEGERQVFILGVPRDVMDGNIRALKSAGISPRVVEFKTMALARAVNKGQALILNIESTSFDIIMVVKGVPVIMFSQPWRRDNMSSADAVEHLATNLEITIDFYNSHHLDEPFDMTNPYYVTGQVSVEPELMEQLRTRLGFDFEELKPPLEYPALFPASHYAVNIGLSIRREMSLRDGGGEGGFFPLDLNLLPPAYLPWRPTSKQLFYTGILISAVTLVFPLVEITDEETRKTVALELKNDTLEGQLQLKMMEIQRREPLQKAINEYQTIIAREGSFSEDIELIINEAERLDVEVGSIAHRKASITITCAAEDYVTFREYLTALEMSGRFTTPIPPPEGYPYTTSGTIQLKTKSGA